MKGFIDSFSGIARTNSSQSTQSKGSGSDLARLDEAIDVHASDVALVLARISPTSIGSEAVYGWLIVRWHTPSEKSKRFSQKLRDMINQGAHTDGRSHVFVRCVRPTSERLSSCFELSLSQLGGVGMQLVHHATTITKHHHQQSAYTATTILPGRRHPNERRKSSDGKIANSTAA